jgi:AcrR family transcriptional regulator
VSDDTHVYDVRYLPGDKKFRTGGMDHHRHDEADGTDNECQAACAVIGSWLRGGHETNVGSLWRGVKSRLSHMASSQTKGIPMSGNAVTSEPKIDARVVRRRDMLGDALVELMVEKPFDEITVQDVLDRAKVSRSTFYSHYRDKDDLFLSDVEEFWIMIGTILTRQREQSMRVAPVRELFAHIAEVRDFYASLVASGKIYDVLDLGQGVFARSIQQRMMEILTEPQPHAAAIAVAHAGALFAMLRWWVDRGMTPSPEEMDNLFHRVVWPIGVEAMR